MKNVERLVSLKNEFRNIKTRLMKAIEERKKIRIHYTELLDAIQSIERDVQSKLDENEKQLADWTTLSENNFLVVEQRQGSLVPNDTKFNP
jgi:molecular chaperone GrpE (heat shock protein)